MPLELDLPDDFSGEVRLFPLPEVVFFPCNALPLHIFESRYREMMEDAVKGDKLIAIATLIPGFQDDYYSRPPVFPHVCIGHASMYEQDDEGKYNLILYGIKRAIIQSEITPVRAYRRATVKVLEDDPIKEDAAEMGAELAEALTNTFSDIDDLAASYISGKLPIGVFTDVVGYLFRFDYKFKMRLLADLDASHRAKLLIQALETTDFSSPPPDFSDN